MKKELIICFSIICAIVAGDIWLKNYTKEYLTLIGDNLTEMKSNSHDEEFNKNKMEEINNEWDKRFNILTCFLDHNELEKVKTQLVSITSGIEVNDFEYVYEELDKTIYILKHIEEKQSLKIDNIF